MAPVKSITGATLQWHATKLGGDEPNGGCNLVTAGWHHNNNNSEWHRRAVNGMCEASFSVNIYPLLDPKLSPKSVAGGRRVCGRRELCFACE